MSLPFSCLCLPPSFRPLVPSTLSAFLPRSCPLFFPPYPTCPLSSLNKLTTDISLAHCISLCCDFVLFFYLLGQLSLFHFLFQRHDAKNGKTDEAWKRMKSLITWPPHGTIELWYPPERDTSYINQVQAHFLILFQRKL